MAIPVILSVDGESGAVVATGVGAQVSGRRRPEDWAVALVRSTNFLSIAIKHAISAWALFLITA